MTTEAMPAGESARSVPTNGAEAMLVVDDVHTDSGQIHALRGI